MIERLVNRIIKSNGVMKKPALRDNEERYLRSLLAKHVHGFLRGEYTTVYLPLTSNLRGFGGLMVVVDETPEKTYDNIKSLIAEVAALTEPIFTDTEAVTKCVERAQITLGGEDRALAFAHKYLSINKELLRDLLYILLQDTVISGTIRAFETLALSEGLENAYEECRRIRMRDGRVAKRLQALARFYDNLLVITGAALHEPRGLGELRFGRGRNAPYTLFSTPFTKALYDVLNESSWIDEYIEAYSGFVSHMVRSYFENTHFELAVTSAASYLNKYRHIGIRATDDNVLRRSVLVLRRLMASILG